MQKSEQDYRVIIGGADLESSSNKSAIRVLHVDDDPCILETSKQILMDIGNFEIDFACCVDEAFKKLSIEHYDIVISDFEMPQKNGLDFLKELREQNNQIPFVLFTGKGREDVAVKALNLGADSYINKNGSPETVYCELADAINKTVERKKSRKLLTKSEAKYRALVENSLQGISILQAAPLRLVFANDAMGKILGYSSQELMALSPEAIMGLVHHEDRATFFRRMENRLRGETAGACYEFRAVRKDGSIIWMSALANRVDYEGQPAVQGMFLDINEGKKTEEILRESEARYRELANSLPDIVFETDLKGQLIFANEKASEISGYSFKELEKGLNIMQFLAPEDRERATNNIQRLLAGGSSVPVEYTFFRKDGSTFPALIIATPRVCKNKLIGLRGLVIDITERRKAEEVVRKSEAKYRELTNSLPEIVFETDMDAKLTYANEHAFEITGYTKEELAKGLCAFDFVEQKDQDKAKEHFKKTLTNKHSIENEYTFVRKDGSTFPTIIVSKPIVIENQTVGLRGIVVDITQSKKTEEACAKQAALIDLSPDAIIVKKLDEKITFWNTGAEKLYGYTKQEALGQKINILLKAKYFKSLDEIITQLKQGKNWTGEITNYTKNNNEVIVQSHWSATLNAQGDIEEILESNVDITQRKKAEEVVRKSEAKYRELANFLPEIVFETDLTGKITFFSQRALEVAGFTREELEKGLNLLSFVVPEERERAMENMKKSLAIEQHPANEYTLLRKNGTTYPAIVRTTPIISGNKVTGLRGIALDITDRKKTEKSLQESEKKFRTIFEGASDGILIADPKTKSFTFANPRICEITGYSLKELLKLNVRDIHPEKDLPYVNEQFTKQLQGKITVALDIPVLRKDKRVVFCDVNSRPAKIGEQEYLVGFFRDITERKKTELSLRESELKFRTLASSSINWVYWVASDGSLIYMSPSAEKITGYTPEEFSKNPKLILQIVDPQDAKANDPHLSSIDSKIEHSSEFRIRTKSGETRWISHFCKPVFDDDGKWRGRRVTNIDITERKKAEVFLRQERDMLESVAAASGAGLVTINKDYHVLWANDFIKRYKGDTIGKLCYATLNSLDAPCQDCGVTKIFAGKTTFDSHEYCSTNVEGNLYWVEIVATPLRDENGNVTSAVEIAVDITERKKAEETLKVSEEKFRNLSEQSPNMIFIYSRGKVIYANKKCEEILHYKREEFYSPNFSFFSLIAPESVGLLKSSYSAHLKGEEVSPYEYVIVTRDGKRIDAVLSSKLIDYGGEKAILGIVTDVTETRKVQEALMESETQYRQLVTAAQEGIWALDCNYGTVFVNPKMAKMLGYAENEMVGKSLFEFLDKKDIDKAINFLGQSKHGVLGHFEYAFARKDGSRVYVSIEGSVITDDYGKPLGLLAMVADISDRRILEAKVESYSRHLKYMVDLRTAQLKDANERLIKSERLAAIGELAGMVGHDLRNPLAGIKNAVYFLKKKGTAISEVQAKEMLEIMDKAIDHSDKIINDLLDYSREIHLELTESTVPTLLDAALQMIYVPDRIQILNQVHEKTNIRVDADKIIRIFINLIKNSIDAMPEKGTLEISSCQTRDCLKIAFADTGTGIPKETLQKIFAPLFTTKAQGMGFGLAICKRIIEAHGGTITVKTAVNKGTTFTLTLPIKPKVSSFKKQPMLESQNAN